MAKNKENKKGKIKNKKDQAKHKSFSSPFPPLILTDKKSIKILKKVIKTHIGDETKVDTLAEIRRCNELM